MRIILFLPLFFVLLFSSNGLAADAVVTVRGKGELKIPADQAVFSVSVVSEGRSSEQVLDENSEKMDQVLKALRRTGLAEKEISTGQFTIHPVWRSSSSKISDNSRPQIVGFRVANQLLVRTGKLDRVGQLIATAVEAGGNEVSGLRFELSDPNPYKQEAIREATKQAYADARVLVDAAGATLGDIVSMNLDDVRPVPVMAQRAMFAESVGAKAPPVIPGNVTVKASVVIVYEIQQ